MNIALEAARQALAADEVPIGAVVVSEEGDVLSTGFNRTIHDSDPTAHAEVVALRIAGKKMANYRLTGCSVYTTIEPCAMCAGALVNARIARLIVGSADERFGAVRSKFELCDSDRLNHQMEIEFGVLETECRELIQGFFKKKRSLKA